MSSCGCHIGATAGMLNYGIVYCPVHAAAPELLAALEAIAAAHTASIYRSQALAAIAKARGQEASS